MDGVGYAGLMDVGSVGLRPYDKKGTEYRSISILQAAEMPSEGLSVRFFAAEPKTRQV
jgi:hypothetical protein